MMHLNDNLHILVTRPVDQAHKLLAAIKNAGAHGIHFPLLSIEHVISNSAREMLRTLNEYDAVICISQHAARLGLDEIHHLMITPAPHVQWFAMGQSTATILREYGLSAITPDHTGTSEALLALPWFDTVTNKRIMMWCGVGGRELVDQTLSAKGAYIDRVELYQRTIPAYAYNELDQLLIEHTVNIIMLTSGQALANLWQLATDKERLTNTTVIVPSERIAAEARKLGIHRVLCANGADDEAMMLCLQQFQLQTVRMA